MMGEVIPLDVVRGIRTNARMIAELQAATAQLRIEADPVLRDRLLFALLVERRARYTALLGHVAGPLMDLVCIALAQQRAAGEPIDLARALMLVTGDRRLLDLDANLDAVMAGLPAALARMPPELLNPPTGDAAP